MKQTSPTKHIPAADEAPKLTAKDLARAHLRVGLKDVSPDEFRAALKDAVRGVQIEDAVRKVVREELAHH